MKSVLNYKRPIWVCPARLRCKTHRFNDGEPCGHDTHHTENMICKASDCNEFTHVECRWVEE